MSAELARPSWRQVDRRIWTGHRPLVVAVALATVVRILAMVAYHPALWFNDSFEYLGIALRLRPYPVRPDGYSLFLRALLPLHSLVLVAALQHLMGIAVGVLVYALLRRFGVARWAATLAAVPSLFDGNIIELEQIVLSDTLFTLLLVAAVVLLLWWRRPTARVAAAVGVLLAAATLTRVAGLPFILLAAGYLLARRVGLRAVVALLVAFAVPVLAYAGWFDAANGRFALTNSDGVFLYARTTSFADCRTMRPPADLLPLCPHGVPRDRWAPSGYIWDKRAPLNRMPGARFGTRKDHLTLRFAEDAILAQPWSYLATVTRDLGRSFAWNRSRYPNRNVLAGYTFTRHPRPVPTTVFIRGGTALGDARRYEHGNPNPHAVQPLAGWLHDYQQVVWLRGPLLAALLLCGLVGLFRLGRRRRRVAEPALVVATGVLLLVLPVATAAFDYRYVPPAIPFAAAGAVLAVSRAVSVPVAGEPVQGPAGTEET